MKSRFLWVLLAGFLAGPARAADLSQLDDPMLGTNRYDRCLELVKRNAASAINQANGWYQDGGGPAALHCQALALVELKRFDQAAEKLEEATRNGIVGSARERADLMDQAGNAWLLAGKSDKAEAAFSSALAFVPQDEDTLTDRARARGLRKDWTGADADLSAVIALDPNRADALVLRASARHALGRKAEARADIARALDVDPDYPEALLERGVLKLEGGDGAGARADWQRVVSVAPGTDAAQMAQTRLQAMSAKSTKR